MRDRGSERGVTLIELLVAVLLVSLLSVAILMTMRVGLNAMERTNVRMTDNRRALSAQRILEKQLNGLMPVVAACLADPRRPPAMSTFFQGEPESMRFVSSYSLEEAARGEAKILEFQVIPGEERRGVRLVVNEHPFTGLHGAGRFCFGLQPDPATGTLIPRFPPMAVGAQSFVLADKLAYCRFSFQERLPPPVLERWVAQWVKPGWPDGVRIEMAPLEGGAAQMLPVTLTMPLRVSKVPGRPYQDQQ